MIHRFHHWPRAIHSLFVFLLLACFTTAAAAPAPIPEWIWRPGPASEAASEVVYFRKTFRTPPLIWNSRLTLSADDEADVFLNGVFIASCKRPDQPLRAEVTVRLNQGENVIAIRATNRTGPAGVLVHLNLGGTDTIVTDGSWLVSTNEETAWSTLSFNAAHWQPAQSVGPHGIAPWGDVLGRPAATPVESLAVKEGFRVELIRSAEPEEGSWICLSFDPQGRVLVSPEGNDRPLLRFTLSGNQVARVEPIPAPIRYAMGLLFANDSLYANAKGPEGLGLYRLIDANRNDQFETNEVRLLKSFSAGSEHGYHAVTLGPDGKIYVLNGNGTKVPEQISMHSPHRHYAEDVLSLNPDESSGNDGTRAPEGYILRTDAEGKAWELWMGGLRNSYDFDFNSAGELFTFDSDMEWDWGTPWYRPTRVLHCVSAGEYGWRNSTRSWPEYYPDSLPAAATIGIGSPTGVKFGTKSHFPEKYRRALFVQDWSYGRILAVHLEPHGASYSGKAETFLQGRPLNLTSMAFGPDGAMYFTTGGRGTQSGLYRVSYAGNRKLADAPKDNSRSEKEAATLRSLRHELEMFHGREDARAIDLAWPHLKNPDRWIRYAARLAIESQPAIQWRGRALNEKNPTSALTALLAVARVGESRDQLDLLNALARFPFPSLSEEQKLLKLRVLEVSFVRQGKPERDLARRAVEDLNPHFPAASWPLNRELSRILIFLEAPGIVHKTVGLATSASTQEQQLHYVAQLRNLRSGWTLEDRRTYFGWWSRPRDSRRHPAEVWQWFADVGRSYVDGASMNNYLGNFRRDAIATLTPDERVALAPLIERPAVPAQSLPATPRKFVREWKMSELVADLDRVAKGRNFARGRQVFVEAQCLSCHRFGNDGGAVGPELTAVGSKYTRRDILEAILEPSKVVSEQYQNTTAILNDGETLTGRLVSQSDRELVIETDRLSGAREKIDRKKLREIRPAALSPMPEGLMNSFSKEEILDLLAYLEANGRADSKAFRK